MTPAPSITVVVPTRNRPDLLAPCLESIRASIGDGDELLVVDSASTDPAVRDVADAHGAHYVRADRPGASRARNLGWRTAANDLVAFIDDDVRVTPGWAAAMRTRLAAPGLCFVTGAVEEPPDRTSERPVALLDRGAAEEITIDTGEANFGHSANLGVKRSAMLLVGGFDEALGAGMPLHAAEDVDLFDRLLAAGCTGVYDPEVRAWHEPWRGREHFVALDWGYGVGMGARMMKLIKTNRPRLGFALYVTFWAWGFRDLYYQWRMRRRFVAAIALVRMGGALAGMAQAARLRVRHGHFVSPPTRGR
ncbi:MAG: hypothetical protein QOE92_765 [Chloroflexota bacterium]|nr:hypothetical protein [Chloroflexota bacterium]